MEISPDYDHNSSTAEGSHQHLDQDYVLSPIGKIPTTLDSTGYKINSQSLELIYDLITELYEGYNNERSTYLPSSTPMILEALNHRKNISEVMSSITDMMTYHIRTGPNSTFIHGTASYPEIYVVVRWRWFVLPGLLVLLTVIFFALTVWDSSAKKGGPPLWKSSVLPFLFHGLDGWSEEELKVSSREGIDVVAEKMKARILRNDEGVRKFVRAWKQESGAASD